MAAIEGEIVRQVTLVVIDEVKNGDWGIGDNPPTTNDVKALAAGKSKGLRIISAAAAAELGRSASARIDERLSGVHALSDTVQSWFGLIDRGVLDRSCRARMAISWLAS